MNVRGYETLYSGVNYASLPLLLSRYNECILGDSKVVVGHSLDILSAILASLGHKYHQNNPNRVKHLQQEVGLVIFCIFKCEYSSLMFDLQIVSK